MTDTPQPRDDTTRRTLRWLLAGQLCLAALLVMIDIAPRMPGLLSPSTQPEFTSPTRPGDQTRRYRPRDPASPVPGVGPDMPRRLLAEEFTVDDAPALRLRGAISPGDGARIVEELEKTQPRIVTFDSPGGSVFDALEIGRKLRQIEARTRLDAGAFCLSACPYAFVGGSGRAVDESAHLGVHQHRFGESSILPAFLAVEDVQRGQAEVLDHLHTMGIDLKIMAKAMATPADEIYILTAEEMTRWNVTTE